MGSSREAELTAKKQTAKRKKSEPFEYRRYPTTNEKLQFAAEEMARRCLKNTREVEDAICREIEQIDWVGAMIEANRQDDWVGDFMFDEVLRIELLCKARIATSRWPAYAQFSADL